VSFPLPDGEFDRLSDDLERRSPQAVLRWAVRAFRGKIALACSFGGPTGLTLLDMLWRIDPEVPVYYLDTGLLFDETLALVARISARYGITPVPVRPELTVSEQAAAFGDKLWERDPDRCCALRKVRPQRTFLQLGYDAWIAGLRRDQLEARQAVRVLERDRRFGLVKLNPLAGWSERAVWQYLAENNVPTNALHARGYSSIGCMPCTQTVAAGESSRAGRWRGFAKIECGLHAS
jgi:phosphoadenosine phosphosulfate reductase